MGGWVNRVIGPFSRWTDKALTHRSSREGGELLWPLRIRLSAPSLNFYVPVQLQLRSHSRLISQKSSCPLLFPTFHCTPEPADSGVEPLVLSLAYPLTPTFLSPPCHPLTMAGTNPTGFDIKEFKAAASPRSVWAKKDPWAR